jgi:hypothetical protein
MNTIDLSFLLDGSSHEELLSKWNEMSGYHLAEQLHRYPDLKFSFEAEFEEGDLEIEPMLDIYVALDEDNDDQPILLVLIRHVYARVFPLNAVPVASPFSQKGTKGCDRGYISGRTFS